MCRILPEVTFRNGVTMPVIAYGTYQAAQENNEKIILTAIEAGYRCFDTASFYQTEPHLAKAISESQISREEFFITSKLWKTQMGYSQTLQAFEESLNRLQTDYLDLYLIHWPLPEVGYEHWKELDLETWRAMEELYRSGKVRAIGVSNFLPHHLENLMQHSSVAPMVNQIEFHPGYTQQATLQYCKEKGIIVEGWSPIGRARVLQDELILELAQKYGVSAAQICLRFALQKGVVPLPKSSNLQRMKENMDLFSFSVSQEDMYRLDTMPQLGWSGQHPDRERA